LGQSISVAELVARVVAASGKTLRISHDLSKPSIPFDLTLDCEKARRELGWEPAVSLDDGIRRTVGWWREHVGTDPLLTGTAGR
jgi:nucleoside-diphosphate-sugar epimerase